MHVSQRVFIKRTMQPYVLYFQLSVARNFRQGVMVLDDVEIGITESPGRARSINGAKPYYVGGVVSPEDLPKAAVTNLGVSS